MAVLIEGAKIGAIVQLGILAAEVIAAQAAAPFTLGLSEVGALGATQVTRVIVKRLFKEVCQQVAEQVVSIALTPVEEALGAMVGDLVVQLGANALGVKDGVDLGQTAKAGKEGFAQGVQGAKDAAKSAADNPMQLLSAGGGGGAGGGSGAGSGGFTFDHDAHDKAVTGLHSVGGHFRNTAGGKIGRAKSHHGRTRGKDAIADAANAMLDKVIDGIEDAVKKSAKHLDDNMTRGIKQMAKNHKENDEKLSSHFAGLGKGGKKEPKGPQAGGGGRATGKDRSDGRGSKAREQLGKEHPDNNTRDDGAIQGCGDPVDVATGRVFLQQTDISLPGTLPLKFSRKFESSYRAGLRMAPSWSSTADQRLEIDAQGVVFVTEDGRLLTYREPGPAEQVLPSRGPRWPLMRTPDGDWVIRQPDIGRTLYFADSPLSPSVAPLEEVVDRAGNYLTFDYDAFTGCLTGVRHSGGYELKFRTDAAGRVSELSLAGAIGDSAGHVVASYTYDSSGNLASVVKPSGATTLFEYDGAHRMTAWTDSNGHRYEYRYDDRDRCVSQGGDDGCLRYQYAYGEVDRATGFQTNVVTDSKGCSSRYVVNDRLRVVAETDPLGHTWRTSYDSYGRVTGKTDPLGRTVHYAYDAEGRLTGVTRPDGLAFTTSYDEEEASVSSVDASGVGWYQRFDQQGNRILVVGPDGTYTRYTYSEYGHLVAISDSSGKAVSIRTDPAGLPVVVTDSMGASFAYARDAFGRVTSVTDSLGHVTELVWDAEGNLLVRREPDGSEQSWVYDGEGNCTAHVDSVGSVTKFEYGNFDRMIARTDPDGSRHRFVHDTELRLVEVVNPLGAVWHYEYDPVGRIRSETDFAGRTVSYTHDAVGQLVRRTNALGQTVAFEYDALGRVIAKESDGAVTAFQYDQDGRLLRAEGRGALLRYVRDSMGRVTSETINGSTLEFSYDALGRRTRRTTPTGAVTDWAYDAQGRPIRMTTGDRVFRFEYDPMGRESSRAVDDWLTFAHEWDERGNLAGQTVTGRAGTVQRRAYRYREDGYLVGVDDLLNGTRRFDLDAVGRVVSIDAANWTETYAYDTAGNQTRATWPTRHPFAESCGERAYEKGKVTQAGGVRYEYDAQGRLTLRRKNRISRKPDVWRYEWDAEDRLTCARTPDGRTWRYLYDPLGRRIAKQCWDADGENAIEQVAYVWDGFTIAEQTSYRLGARVSTTLTWDHKGLHPVAQTERRHLVDAEQSEIDSRFFAIVTDLVGTPTELVDESGTLAWRAKSTLWGVTGWTQDAVAMTPLRFAGQYFDQETGLHYNVHRYYDPETARYISSDPLGLAPAPNPVTYVHNPYSWIDPLGLTPCGDNEAAGKPPPYPSVVLGVNPPSDMLAEHLRANGHPEAQTFNGPRYANVEAGTPVWMSNVMGAVGDRRVALHVTLDEMPGAGHTPESISQAFERAVVRGQGFGTGPGQELPPAGFGTAWEMSVIARNVRVFNAGQAEGEDFGGRSWDSIHWYSGNQRVHDVPEPESLRHRRR
ncbi:DUF6531 domain-containing protein [Streptomyces rimosus]|uniref:DUF6531 domain-containing protein n=1 Tax=Streptomyces rimosus TaxID=1927 RepID=UPI0031D01FB3